MPNKNLDDSAFWNFKKTPTNEDKNVVYEKQPPSSFTGVDDSAFWGNDVREFNTNDKLNSDQIALEQFQTNSGNQDRLMKMYNDGELIIEDKGTYKDRVDEIDPDPSGIKLIEKPSSNKLPRKNAEYAPLFKTAPKEEEAERYDIGGRVPSQSLFPQQTSSGSFQPQAEQGQLSVPEGMQDVTQYQNSSLIVDQNIKQARKQDEIKKLAERISFDSNIRREKNVKDTASVIDITPAELNRSLFSPKFIATAAKDLWFTDKFDKIEVFRDLAGERFIGTGQDGDGNFFIRIDTATEGPKDYFVDKPNFKDNNIGEGLIDIAKEDGARFTTEILKYIGSNLILKGSGGLLAKQLNIGSKLSNIASLSRPSLIKTGSKAFVEGVGVKGAEEFTAGRDFISSTSIQEGLANLAGEGLFGTGKLALTKATDIPLIGGIIDKVRSGGIAISENTIDTLSNPLDTLAKIKRGYASMLDKTAKGADQITDPLTLKDIYDLPAADRALVSDAIEKIKAFGGDDGILYISDPTESGKLIYNIKYGSVADMLDLIAPDNEILSDLLKKRPDLNKKFLDLSKNLTKDVVSDYRSALAQVSHVLGQKTQPSVKAMKGLEKSISEGSKLSPDLIARFKQFDVDKELYNSIGPLFDQVTNEIDTHMLNNANLKEFKIGGNEYTPSQLLKTIDEKGMNFFKESHNEMLNALNTIDEVVPVDNVTKGVLKMVKTRQKMRNFFSGKNVVDRPALQVIPSDEKISNKLFDPNIKANSPAYIQLVNDLKNIDPNITRTIANQKMLQELDKIVKIGDTPKDLADRFLNTLDDGFFVKFNDLTKGTKEGLSDTQMLNYFKRSLMNFSESQTSKLAQEAGLAEQAGKFAKGFLGPKIGMVLNTLITDKSGKGQEALFKILTRGGYDMTKTAGEDLLFRRLKNLDTIDAFEEQFTNLFMREMFGDERGRKSLE